MYRNLLVVMSLSDTPLGHNAAIDRRLNDPFAPPNSASHYSSYPFFPVGTMKMALYPDNSCSCLAEVQATCLLSRKLVYFIPVKCMTRLIDP